MSVEIRSRRGKVLYVAKNATDVRQALTEAVRERADLRDANLRGAYLGGAYLGGAYLGDANLGGAYLGGAYLGDANLRGANLGGAYLGGAYLGGAYLRGANLGGANLRGAYLRGANLRGANLGGAYLGGAYLRDAYLGDANLRDAKGFNPYRVNDLLLLKDQVGKVRAYKLVNEEGEGPFNGGIRYEVGQSYEVPDADEDESRQCGAGINLATLPWCLREWRPGYRVLLAEFAAKDIAAVPVGDGKFRVRRCRIVRELDLAEYGVEQ